MLFGKAGDAGSAAAVIYAVFLFSPAVMVERGARLRRCAAGTPSRSRSLLDPVTQQTPAEIICPTVTPHAIGIFAKPRQIEAQYAFCQTRLVCVATGLVCVCVGGIDATEANCCITNSQQIDRTARPYDKVGILKVSGKWKETQRSFSLRGRAKFNMHPSPPIISLVSGLAARTTAGGKRNY